VANVGGFDTLYTATAFLNACDYLLCGAALFVLRQREPNLRRPYKAFGYPSVPAIALIVSAVLLVVFVIGNTRPSLLAIAVVAVTYPVFRVIRHERLHTS
jgi:basic amino acid/polyamine antiporter, APA family